MHERQVEYCVEYTEQCQQHHCADDVEIEVYQRRALSVFVGVYRGDHRGDTGSYILSHDDRDRSSVGDRAGGREGLEDTDRCTGGLDQCRDADTDEKPENRILEHHEQISEAFAFAEPRYRGGHIFHSHHKDGEAEKDRAHVLFLAVFRGHIQEYTDKRKDRDPRGGLEPAEDRGRGASAVQAGQTDQPRGDRRAEV